MKGSCSDFAATSTQPVANSKRRLPGVFESRSIRLASVTYAGLEFPTAFPKNRPGPIRKRCSNSSDPVVGSTGCSRAVLVFLGRARDRHRSIPDMLPNRFVCICLLSKPIFTGLVVDQQIYRRLARSCCCAVDAVGIGFVL